MQAKAGAGIGKGLRVWVSFPIVSAPRVKPQIQGLLMKASSFFPRSPNLPSINTMLLQSLLVPGVSAESIIWSAAALARRAGGFNHLLLKEIPSLLTATSQERILCVAVHSEVRLHMC